jgi:hypothetical protein
MKRFELKQLIKEEVIKILTEEDIHWSAINFRKEKEEGNTPSLFKKKEGETANQAKERMKSELRMKYGKLIDKYLNKKDMNDAYSAFKNDPEFSKIDSNLRNNIMNTLARFFYYSSNLQEITVNKPNPFKDKLKAIGVDYNSIEIDGVNPNDYPDYSDVYISHAEWKDGTPLTNEELNKLNNIDKFIEYAYKRALNM